MNSTRKHRGADALTQTLEAAGPRRVFTLSDNRIILVLEAAFDSKIELIHTRHEASTVHMADASARITGEVGIAFVTGGPGRANAVSALYTAQMAEAPIVLLPGHAPNDQLGQGAFQETRQADMAAPVTKGAWVCASADGVASDIAKAIVLARSGRPGPVHLSLPTDVLDGVAAASALTADAFVAEPMPLGDRTATDLMQCLAQAKRPMILLGPSCLTRSGRALIAALEEASGIPVIGMESPRGIADASLGGFAQVLAQADCLLLVGKRVDFTLQFGKAPFPAEAQVHQIDTEPAEVERTRRALGTRLQSTALIDVASALMALAQAAHPAARGDWFADVRSAIAYRPPAWDTARSEAGGRLHPVQTLRPHRRCSTATPMRCACAMAARSASGRRRA